MQVSTNLVYKLLNGIALSTLLIMSPLYVFASPSVEACTDTVVGGPDRRGDTLRLTIIRQLSFPNPEAVHKILTFDPASGETEEEWSQKRHDYFERIIGDTANIIITDVVGNCADLLSLKAASGVSAYRPYLVEITNAKRKLGVLSQFDLTSGEALEPDFEKYRDVTIGAQMYYFKFDLNSVPIVVAGAYLTTDADVLAEANSSQLYVDLIADQFEILAKKTGARIIFFADLNDYAFSDPLDARKTYERQVGDAFLMSDVLPFKSLPKRHTDTDFGSFEPEVVINWRAPIFISESLEQAALPAPTKVEVTTQQDAEGVTRKYANATRAYAIFDANKIQLPFPYLLLLVGALVVGILIWILITLRNRRQDAQHIS